MNTWHDRRKKRPEYFQPEDLGMLVLDFDPWVEVYEDLAGLDRAEDGDLIARFNSRFGPAYGDRSPATRHSWVARHPAFGNRPALYAQKGLVQQLDMNNLTIPSGSVTVIAVADIDQPAATNYAQDTRSGGQGHIFAWGISGVNQIGWYTNTNGWNGITPCPSGVHVFMWDLDATAGIGKLYIDNVYQGEAAFTPTPGANGVFMGGNNINVWLHRWFMLTKHLNTAERDYAFHKSRELVQ